MSRKRRKPQPLPAAAPKERKATSSGHLSNAIIGQRLRISQDSPLSGLSGFSGLMTDYDSSDPEHRWRDLDLDSSTLDRMQAGEVSELLCDLSPEVSRALWDFLRMSNPGFEVKAYRTGVRDGEKTVDVRAQAALDEWHGRLGDLYGSIDVVINRLFFNAFLRGGFFAELVLDNAGRAPVDLATPDSRHLRWRQENDAVRGPVWKPFQWVKNQRVDLDRPTIRYVPIDPFPGKPQGRALATPAFFTVLFAMSLLRDLKRVVMQQGWPRIEIKIDLEKLATQIPHDIVGDPVKEEAWVESIIARVASEYAQLQPDDAYAHTNVTELAGPVGAVDSASLGSIDGILEHLDKAAVRALKTFPLMFGINEATSETHANRVWEIHIASLKALQHLAEGVLGYLDELALQSMGMQATVEWRFAEVRAAELMRDAQVQSLKLMNGALGVALGYWNQDEGCLYATGKKTADLPAPRIPTAGIKSGGSGAGSGGGPAGAAADAEDGAERGLLPLNGKRMMTRDPFTPAGADVEPLPVPDEVEVDAATIRAALVAWNSTLPDYEGLLDAEVVG